MDGKRFRIILIGDSGVGKTSVCIRVCKRFIRQTYDSTIGAMYYEYRTVISTENILLEVWDLGGQRCYSNLIEMFGVCSSGAFVFYSVSSPESFNSIKFWVEKLDTLSKVTHRNIILVGNKSDLPDHERLINFKLARQLSTQYHFGMCAEVSAVSGENVKDIFEEMAKHLYYQRSVNQVIMELPSKNAKKKLKKAEDFVLQGIEDMNSEDKDINRKCLKLCHRRKCRLI